jgi:hypothetical protein
MGPIGYPEMSVSNYQSTLHDIPEERISRLHRGGSLNSRVVRTGCHMYGSFNLNGRLCENKVCFSRSTLIIQGANEYFIAV